MWKNSKYFYCSLRQLSCTQNGFANQIFTVLRVRSSNQCSVRYQNTTKFGSHIVKPTQVKYTRPPDMPKPLKEDKRITGGEWTLLIIPLTTFCLGTWQVYRREWKMKIIDHLESKLSEPAVELPDDLVELSEMEYRKVKVKGKFDHSAEIYFGPRSLIVNGESASQSGLISAGAPRTAGHYVITPFILPDGRRILVNRGWVPTKSLLPNKRLEGQIENEVELVGVVRLQETRGTFVPENKPQLKVYHYRDLKKMAKKTESLPVLLDATVESTVPGGPIGGQTNIAIRNEHMSYIVTCFRSWNVSAYIQLKAIRIFKENVTEELRQK